MENKKEPLLCVICGRNDSFRLVLRNTLMPDEPPYVICLECAGEVDNKYKKEIQNEN